MERGVPHPFHACVISVALAVVLLGSAGPSELTQVAPPDPTQAAEFEYEPDVILVMKDQTFHVVKGAAMKGEPQRPSFSLVAGGDAVILLRNEDRVAHEFVSPLFHRVEFQFSGKATIVYTHTATGVRIDPGESVILRFELPERSSELFSFWCNVHGKLHGDPMRGEIFVLEPTKEISH